MAIFAKRDAKTQKDYLKPPMMVHKNLSTKCSHCCNRQYCWMHAHP